MPDKEAEALVQDLGIAPCPGLITRVLREARSDEPDFKRIAALISTDVALSAAMLAAVNSTWYGLRRKAETVHRALIMLGLQTCTDLVTRLMLRQVFPVPNAPGMKRFWAAAARASLMAGVVARTTRRVDPEVASTFALFRDAGMPLLLARFPQYAQLMTPERISEGAALLDAENACCGMNHVRIGSQLARNWELIDDVCLAIHHHHDYAMNVESRAEASESSLLLVAVGLVTDGLAAEVATTPHPEWERSREFALEQLSLGDDDMDKLVRSASAATSSSG